MSKSNKGLFQGWCPHWSFCRASTCRLQGCMDPTCILSELGWLFCIVQVPSLLSVKSFLLKPGIGG